MVSGPSGGLHFHMFRGIFYFHIIIYIHSVYIYIVYIYVYIIYHVFLRAFPKVANFFEVRRNVLKQPAQPGSTQSFLGVSEASMLVKLYIYI